jgi:hypothetical protein
VLCGLAIFGLIACEQTSSYYAFVLRLLLNMTERIVCCSIQMFWSSSFQ